MADESRGYSLETRCVAGNGTLAVDRPYGSVSMPIFASATFAHPGVGETTGYNYTRESNPTRTELEHTMSALEGACDTLATTSGMAAISLVLTLFSRGDNIVCTEDLYGGSVRMFDKCTREQGVTFTYVDTSSAQAVRDALTPQTKALYIETPSNPTMLVTDLAQMKAIADEHHLLLIVDNTFLSPYFQNPIACGADFVIHSATKYLGGHNDVMAGMLCSAPWQAEAAAQLRYTNMTMGANLSPFDSYLVLRGIKTLAIRMERCTQNAQQIAEFLQTQPKVTAVYYVGLPDNPGYEVNRRQARGAGGMISFRVDSEETARQVLERVHLIAFAESLGGVESLITYPMMQTHHDVPVETRERLGITADFLRLSVGIEGADDLIADLRQALA